MHKELKNHIEGVIIGEKENVRKQTERLEKGNERDSSGNHEGSIERLEDPCPFC